MENPTLTKNVFKSDVIKAGFKPDSVLHKDLTCLNHEVQELKKEMLDDLNEFRRIKQEGEPGKEIMVAVRNNEITGKNSILRISIGTNPTVESWDIKESIGTLDALIFVKQYDDFTREQNKNQEYELARPDGVNYNLSKSFNSIDLQILKDSTQLKSSTGGESLVDYAKERMKSKGSKAVYNIEEIKLDGKIFSIVNKKGPNGNDDHYLQIADNKNFRYIFFNREFSFEEAVKKAYKDDDKKIGVLLNKYEAHERKKEKGTIKNFIEKAVNYLPEKVGLISDQIALAKKMGYVQGVCECVAAIGDDHALGKKLLSEMNVTKDLAKKFASPETYKTLEHGIFAQKQEQKLEQTHSIKR